MAAIEADFVDGLSSDCRVLLARFEEKQSVRFEDFCEVWKQLKFSYLHHASIHEWEKIQIVEYLFRVLGHYLIPSCPLQYQVGAVYSMYSLYHTQAVTPKVKIRMTLTMWNDLLNLQKSVKEQEHYDVYYVISSLRADNAFYFVAMPIQFSYGPRTLISQYEREVGKETKANAVKHTQEIIQKVNAIDSLYNSAKMKICSSEQDSLLDPVTLKVASSDLVANLQQDVKDFELWKQTNKDNLKEKYLQRHPELGLPEDRRKESDKQSEQVNLTRSQKVKEIKHRSFTSLTQVSKGKRRHQPVPESPKILAKSKKTVSKSPKVTSGSPKPLSKNSSESPTKSPKTPPNRREISPESPSNSPRACSESQKTHSKSPKRSSKIASESPITAFTNPRRSSESPKTPPTSSPESPSKSSKGRSKNSKTRTDSLQQSLGRTLRPRVANKK